MSILRHARKLAGFVLACFVVSLGVAVAAPMVQPKALELVCSSVGTVKLMQQTDDGAQELGASHLDCPQCVLADAPPLPPAALSSPLPLPLGRVLQPIPAARIAAATAAPLPARGPPAFS